MAKNNNSYIQMMYNQNGDQWIAALKPEDIQRSTKRIVKDMVKGNVNYEKFGIYFLDLKFLENLIIGLSNELEINNLNYISCSFYYTYYPDTQNLASHISHLSILNLIYSTVLERLNYVKGTGNLGYLSDISGLLFSYRNHLN